MRPLLEWVVLLSACACLPNMICKSFVYLHFFFFFFFFSLPLAEGVFCEGDSSVLPPVCSWSQQRDQYVVDAPWPLEGLRRAEGRWAAGQSSLCSSSPCVCPSSFSHFRDPCGILAGGPGRTWVGFSSPVGNLMYSVRLPKGKQFFMLWWGRGHCRAGE